MPPKLTNRPEVGAAIVKGYPENLRKAGIGGEVVVWIRISESGSVEDVQINNSSGHPALDQAAIRVGQTMQFSAAMNRDKPVSVWVSIPITFSVSGGR